MNKMDLHTKPRSATLKTGTVIYGAGKLITMDSTNNTVDLVANGEVCIGVTTGDSSRDSALVLQTAAGATVSYYPLGGVQMVQSTNGLTYTLGQVVYAGANGLATNSSGSSVKKLGVYVGNGEATAALGANGAGDTTNTEGTLIAVNTTVHEIA